MPPTGELHDDPKSCMQSSCGFRYIDAATLSKCASEAQTQGWNGGIMFWEWADVSQAKLDIIKV
jgi:hypothetical protein